MSDVRLCPTCKTTVEPGLHALRLKCKCYVHTKCMNQKVPDFNSCDKCKGIESKIELKESSSVNGHDYVDQPKPKSTITSIKKVWSGEPFIWLKEKKPIEWIISEKKYGLQELLAAGVTIDDFLLNGYNYTDLKTFKDIRERPNQALFALHCNMEHFRDYSHQLPLKDMPHVNGQAMVEYFGFYFPEGGKPAEVFNGKNDIAWKARDLIDMGFSMRDLFGAELQYLEQFASLEASDEEEIRMGVTDQDIDRLPLMAKKSVKPVKVAEPVKPVELEEPVVTYVSSSRPRMHRLKNK